MSIVTRTVDAEALVARAVTVGRAGMLLGRGGPFGALIVGPDGAVVAEGCNRVTSTNDPTAHAEVVAIRTACAELATFVLGGYSLVSSCEPCPMCLAAAYWARVDAIVFGATRDDAARAGFDDGKIYGEIGLAPSARSVPTWQANPSPARDLFDEWLAREDRTPY